MNKITPGMWLFVAGAIYFIAVVCNIFVYRFAETEFIQVTWLAVLSMPLYIRPLGRWVGLKSYWS